MRPFLINYLTPLAKIPMHMPILFRLNEIYTTMYKGKSKGFGQRFDPLSGISIALIRSDIKENNINNNLTMPNDDEHLKEAIRRAARAFQLRDQVPMMYLNKTFQFGRLRLVYHGQIWVTKQNVKSVTIQML